jgi:hypothetical protein
MKKTPATVLLLLTALVVQAAPAPANFSGNWTFDWAQSKNIGMRSQARIQTTVTQSKTRVVVNDNSVFSGRADTQHTIYDLTGKPVFTKDK